MDIKINPANRDYYIISCAFLVVPLCFLLDSIASYELQLALGIAGYITLLGLLQGESEYIKYQIIVAIVFATIGEHFASIFMQGYVYRLGNIPAFVPPGHGIVYLTAVVLGRSKFFLKYTNKIMVFVVFVAGLWSLLTMNSIVGRKDELGTILFCIYLLYLFKGRSRLMYLGAFFITTWVELLGTALKVWSWAIIDPASTLAQGNPPSGVAAWYCLVDAVAISCAATVQRIAHKILNFFSYTKNTEPINTDKTSDNNS